MMCCINCNSVFDEPRHRASLSLSGYYPDGGYTEKWDECPGCGSDDICECIGVCAECGLPVYDDYTNYIELEDGICYHELCAIGQYDEATAVRFLTESCAPRQEIGWRNFLFDYLFDIGPFASERLYDALDHDVRDGDSHVHEIYKDDLREYITDNPDVLYAYIKYKEE